MHQTLEWIAVAQVHGERNCVYRRHRIRRTEGLSWKGLLVVGVGILVLLSSSTSTSAANDLPRSPEPFKGTIGDTYADSKAAFPTPVTAQIGAPNILLILTDDTCRYSKYHLDRSQPHPGALPSAESSIAVTCLVFSDHPFLKNGSFLDD